MLAAYFDDAGTHRDSGAVVLAGVMATEAQWATFTARWQALLANPLPGKSPLEMFHLSNCRACVGEFRGYSRAESDAITRDFRQIMIESGLVSTASAVDRVAWDDLVTERVRDVLGDALQAAFVNCMDRAFAFAANHPQTQTFSVHFDQGIRTPKLVSIAEHYTLHAGGKPWLRVVDFRSVGETPPLQAADMIATETYWHALDWIKDGANASARAHFQRWIERELGEGLIMDRAEIAAEITRRNDDGSLR